MLFIDLVVLDKLNHVQEVFVIAEKQELAYLLLSHSMRWCSLPPDNLLH